jgi:hypothetical protein
MGWFVSARYSPRSLNLITNEIARRREGKAARRDGGSRPGGQALPFFVVFPAFEGISQEAGPFAKQPGFCQLSETEIDHGSRRPGGAD